MTRFLVLLWHLACILLAVCVAGPVMLLGALLVALGRGVEGLGRTGTEMWLTAWSIFKNGDAE